MASSNQTSSNRRKRRCSGSLSDCKRISSGSSNLADSSSSDLDSGLETFLLDPDSHLENRSDFPGERRDSDGFHELLCIEDNDVFSDIRPAVIKMDKAKNRSPTKHARSVMSPSTRDNRSEVLMVSQGKKKENFVTGESLVKFPASSGDSAPSSSSGGTFRIRHYGWDHAKRQKDEPFHLAECPFVDKENWSGYRRDPQLFGFHPDLSSTMRSMLLEWMMEYVLVRLASPIARDTGLRWLWFLKAFRRVPAEYLLVLLLFGLWNVSKAQNLQRKTYQMALDYVDRFLSFTEYLHKSILQLLGISALSIAAKIEEIFPPKIGDMAYVTDDAHTVDDIKVMERTVLSVLGTAFLPVTPCEWVGMFLHQAGVTGSIDKIRRNHHKINKLCVENQLPLELYSRICRVVDLAMLDHTSMRFPYRHIAASAILLSDCETQITKSLAATMGSEVNITTACMEWMRPFAEIEKNLPPVRVSCPSRVSQMQWPHLQSHDISLDIFSEAMELQRQCAMAEQNENAPEDRKLLEMTDFDSDDEVEIVSIVTPQKAPVVRSKAAAAASSFITPPDSHVKKRHPRH